MERNLSEVAKLVLSFEEPQDSGIDLHAPHPVRLQLSAASKGCLCLPMLCHVEVCLHPGRGTHARQMLDCCAIILRNDSTYLAHTDKARAKAGCVGSASKGERAQERLLARGDRCNLSEDPSSVVLALGQLVQGLDGLMRSIHTKMFVCLGKLP